MSKIILLIVLAIFVYRVVARLILSGSSCKEVHKSPKKKMDFTKDQDIADGEFKEL